MQHVLPPPVDATVHAAEVVRHREGDATPVMSLHLRHGDDHGAGAGDDLGEPQLSEGAVPAAQSPEHDPSGVEVDERSVDRLQRIEQPRAAHDVLGVVTMSGPFAHDHLRGAQPPHRDNGGSDKAGVGVDDR